MSRLIEYMKEIGLTGQNEIKKYFDTAVLDDVLSFHEYACSAVEEDWSIADYSPYTFAPSMDVSGFGGCSEIGCKLNRANRFAQFSALYGDCIYLIVNSITNACFPDKENEVFPYREQMKCDFLLIHQYAGLLEADIVRIIPTHFQVCSDCFQKYVCNRNDLSSVEPIAKEYAAKAIISADAYIQENNLSLLSVSNLPELFPDHDGYFAISGKIASRCQNADTFPHLITDRSLIYEFIKRHLIDEMLTAKYESFISSTYQAKYITCKSSDKVLLDMTHENTVGHTPPPVFNMPFLSNASTKTILDLRSAEQDSFNEYRLSLDQATKCYLSSRSNTEAKDIYDDIVYPAFVKLDAMFSRAKRIHARTHLGELLVSLSTVTLGVLNSSIPKDPAAITAAFCGSEFVAAQIGNVIERKLNTGNELEKQDFYFLWKLKQRA